METQYKEDPDGPSNEEATPYTVPDSHTSQGGHRGHPGTCKRGIRQDKRGIGGIMSRRKLYVTIGRTGGHCPEDAISLTYTVRDSRKVIHKFTGIDAAPTYEDKVDSRCTQPYGALYTGEYTKVCWAFGKHGREKI